MQSDPTSSIESLVQQANELIASERFDDAERMLLDLVKGNDVKSNLACYDALSTFSETRGKVEDSIRYALQGLAAAKSVHGEESDQVVAHMERVAALYEETGRFEEANDLIYRAQIIKDKLVFSEAEPEPEIGSSEEEENKDSYSLQSTVSARALSRKEEKHDDDESAESDLKITKKRPPDPGDQEKELPKFVVAEDEPREHRPGWLMEEIQRQRSSSANQPKIEEPLGPQPPAQKSKGEITGAHQFRMEEPKDEEPNRFKSKLRSIKDDNNKQRESTTSAPKSRKELEITSSSMKAVVDTTEQLSRTLQMGSIRWSLKEFLQRKNSLYWGAAGLSVAFFIVLTYAYMQPRKTNPLDVYLGMPHSYRTITGDTKIKLVSDQAAQLQQGDSMSEISTNYVVDWRSKLELFVRSFIERQFWLTKVNSTLVSDDGAVYYTSSNSELLIGDELQNIAQAANDYYHEHSTYPTGANLQTYRNIYTRASALPAVKRSEFIATDSDDVLRKISDWQNELSVPVPNAQPGVIACFELVATHPHGRVEALAVRSCKPKEKPQIIFSIDGQITQQKVVPLVPFEGVQIRWRRIWIDTESRSALEAFILHHASLIISLLVSGAVAATYMNPRFSHDTKQIRKLLLIISLSAVAFYAASPYLP